MGIENFEVSSGLAVEDKFVIIPLDSDPRISGVEAPISSLGLRDDGTLFQKDGSLVTDWRLIGDEERHRVLDQLVHNIAETSYQEIVYVNNQLLAVIYWSDNTKTVKIREHLYSYMSNRLSTEIVKQYDQNGVLISGQTLTGTFYYTGNVLVNIEWVLS